MLRTWSVRFEARKFTDSVRSRHVPLTPSTFACPPRRPSVPTSRATRVTSAANDESWSTIVLIVALSSSISPRASTVIFWLRSPVATAVVTCAMLRTWPVRLLAMRFTLSVRSRHVPLTPSTSACPPSRPSVPTSRATPVTCSAKTRSRSVIELIVSASVATSPLASTVTFCARSPLATAVVTTAIWRTWSVRLDAMTFTLSVRSFHVPATPRTSAWPPSTPSVPTSRATPVTCSAKTRSVSVIELIVSASVATSPLASTVTFCVRSPWATAVVTTAIWRTWSVRLDAMTLTFSVRSFHVPATPLTSAWPPSTPSVPTSRATRVTSSANDESWSTIVLIVSFSSRISPRAVTVIFCDRSPLATAVVTAAIWRTWSVRFEAIELTFSVRSRHVPLTPLTCAWPPSFPSVPTSRATRVTSSAKEPSWSTISLTVLPIAANSPLTGCPSIVSAIFCDRSPRATDWMTREISVVGRTRSSIMLLTDSTVSLQVPSTVPSETRSVMRPSRPMIRATRASSLAWRALIASSSLTRCWISPMASRRRARRRTLKSPSRAAVRTRSSSSRAGSSRGSESCAPAPPFAVVLRPAGFAPVAML